MNTIPEGYVKLGPFVVPNDPQKLFDEMYRRIVAQGKASTGPLGQCLYRQDKTPECPIRCAAGQFLPDDAYNSMMEGKPTGKLINEACGDATASTDPLRRVLSYAQGNHDDAARNSESLYFVADFKERMARAAKYLNLTCPE